MGTCRMGPAGNADAVVDAEGRVHGLENLTVADASVLPRIPRSTPAWPVAVVGELIAAALIERGRRIEVSA